MDQFVTTYRKDYLWPYIRSFGKRLVEPHPAGAGYDKKCLCRCYPPVPPGPGSGLTGLPSNKFEDVDKQDWSRIGPMGPLLDPKLYPAKVGTSPETTAMRRDQPNTFMKKLHEKYPFIHEILRTAPDSDLVSKVNRDRLRSTYQVDYCSMDEYPPDALLRVSGVGTGVCPPPKIFPSDPYHPTDQEKSFKVAVQVPERKVRRINAISGMPGGGKKRDSAGGDIISKWVPGNSEYQDGISKIGNLIIKDKIHYHPKNRGW